jgi:predicted phosphodiesterase
MITRRNFFKVGGLTTAGLFLGKLNPAQAITADETPVTATLSFLTKPYLQHLTPNEVTVMCVMNNHCRSWIEYRENGRSNSMKAVEITRGLVQVNSRIHKISLKPLKARTSYSYQVFSQEILRHKSSSVTFGTVIQSETHTFTTPGLADNSVSALIFNDLHDKGESLLPRMISLGGEPDYDFVFLNGDILDYLPDENSLLKHLLIPCANLFASEKPFITVRGNHETRHQFARNYFDYFRIGENNQGYCTFTRGPVFFIALDSGEDKTDDHEAYSGLAAFDAFREEQAAWLETQLQSKTCRQALYKVVLMHIPPFESDNWHGTTHCRKVFGPLFKEYNIDMLISGHTHKYGVHLPTDEHPYPLIIGGGRKTSPETTPGNTTIIKLYADASQLTAEIIDYNGKQVGSYRNP